MTERICIPNIENYTQEIIHGELILTPKKQDVDFVEEVITTSIRENEINMIMITHSSIVECVIKKEEELISKSTKYRSVFIDIWKSMPTQKILQTTKFNFKLTKENGEKGYRWCPEINMSFQNKDAFGELKEIIKMVKVNKMTLHLSIKLDTRNIVCLEI